MKQKYIKTNIFYALITIFFIISSTSFFSYKFFASNFVEIENEQNRKNINAILNIVNNELEDIEAIIDDYAKWDDTYEFVNKKNDNFIYENFREGTNTLEELNIDFMIFTNIENKKLFSTYAQKDSKIYSENFERNLINKIEDSSEITSLYKDQSMIVKYKSNYFFITKVFISSSDSKAKPNGYLWGGKHISNKILTDMSKIFDSVKLRNKQLDNTNLIINTQYLKNIKISTGIDNDMLINTIQLYDHKNEYVLSIDTETKRDIYQKGMQTIYIYNLILAIFLFVILFLIYKNQQLLQKHNEELEKKVENKTKHLRKMIAKLKNLTEIDSLTQINNRRNFFRLGNKILKEIKKSNDELSILMIDIDDFKKINDTYGHATGDKVLIKFAQTIKSILDDNHIFGRLGGEEFAIIFNNIDENKAFDLSENIRKKIEEVVVTENNMDIKFTISSGLATSKNSNNLDTILKEADDFLYNAKSRGKNRIIRDR